MSQEKISTLRAYGAEVVITPTAVEHDSPESYYSVSDRLAEEIPGGFKPDQYSNDANPEAHYLTTAPELWERDGRRARRDRDLGRHRRLDLRDRALLQGAQAGRSGSSAPTPRARSSRPTTSTRCTRTSSRGSARTPGRRRWTRPSSTSGSASPTATRSSPPAGSRARRACSSAARAARRRGRRSRSRERLGPGATILMTFPDGGRSYLSKFYDDNWMLQYGFMERRASRPDGRRGDPLPERRRRLGARASSSSTRTRRSAPRST